MFHMSITRFKNMTLNDIRSRIIELDEPKFRASQIFRWVYQKRVHSFDEMNNISKATRQKVSTEFSLDKLSTQTILVSTSNDAVKFGFKLIESDDIVESVLLFDGKRRTACLSSQLGCGLGCAYCATGAMGFIRNLSQDEILGQLIGINDYLESKKDSLVTHIVFMGMGEALSNWDAFKSCCSIIMDKDCFILSAKRITVSTAGVIPSIEKLKKEDLPVNLAISLNGFSDEQRNKYMPINKKYPIDDLVAAAKSFVQETNRQLTFEYVVIPGENDTVQAIKALTKMLNGIPCKVNCIPINANPQKIGATPPIDAVQKFADALYQKGITATVRKSMGQDIDGACGQLATRHYIDNTNQTQ
jgi:23S rRNA (adenine2503-C2)-methyltransferase